jgi:hypothetical protein
MTTDRSADYLVDLVRELYKLPRETEWVEFKVNNADPQEIGEHLSALANGAALVGKGLIVVEDPEVGTRIRSYLPFWAAPGPSPEGIA